MNAPKFRFPGFARRSASGLVALLLMAAFLGGCSEPFTVDILERAEDTTAPVVVLASPENESFYARTVTVTGTVADSTNSETVAGLVSSLRYEIPSASISEPVVFDAAGAFTFSFSTTSFTGGTITIRVVGVDSNGNEGVATLSLLYGGSDIATFEAVPGNQSVTLRWDPVPEVAEYTLKNLGDAEQITLDSDASMYVWEDLENGSRYFFQLLATETSGDVNESSEVSAIPLSPYTLLPEAFSYDDRVLITWRRSPGVTTYVVEKATDIDGPYQKRFETGESEVQDTLVLRDQYYYYRIYPAGQDSIKSAPAEATLIPFSVTGTEPGSYFGPLVNSRMIRGFGSYVVVSDRDVANTTSYIRILDATDPANLVEVGSVATGDATFEDMVVDPVENLVFIAEEEQGVKVVDISNVASPAVVSLTDPAGRFLGEPAATADPDNEIYSFVALGITHGTTQTYIFGAGETPYIYSARVDRSGGNISLVPTASAGAIGGDSNDNLRAMVVRGSAAYVTHYDQSLGQSGIRRFDLSDPETAIAAVGGAVGYQISSSVAGDAIAVTEDYVFIEHYYNPGTPQYSVRVLDVAASFNQIASYDFAVRVQHLTIADDVLYVSAGSSEVQGFDISTPPSGTGASPVVVPDLAGPAYSSVVVGDFLAVAAQTGIESFRLLPAIGYGSQANVVGAYVNMKDFTSVGTSAHVLGLGSSFPPSTANFYTADLTSPETLTSLNLVAGLDGGSQIVLQGDRELLLSTSLDTVRIISPPSSSDPVVTSEFLHTVREIYSIGDVTYGITGAIVSIFDTSDGESVSQIRSIGFDHNIIELAARGDYMYATYLTDIGSGRSSGIIVLDISDPVFPAEVNRIAAPSNVAFHDMELFGDELFVPFSENGATYRDGTDDSSGMMIYSVADDPETPTLTGTYTGDDVFSSSENWTKRFEHIEVRGHLVALSSGQSANANRYRGRVVLLNAADPGNIVKVKDVVPDLGHAPSGTPDFPQAIHFWRGAYLFVMGRNELTVYRM